MSGCVDFMWTGLLVFCLKCSVLHLRKLQNQPSCLFSSFRDSPEPHCVPLSEQKIRRTRRHKENSLFGRTNVRTELLALTHMLIILFLDNLVVL